MPDFEWFQWIYGRWFLGHPWRGYFVVSGIASVLVALIIGAMWLRALDAYNKEHGNRPDSSPPPIGPNAPAPRTGPSPAPLVDDGMRKAGPDAPVAERALKRDASPTATPESVPQKPRPDPLPGASVASAEVLEVDIRGVPFVLRTNHGDLVHLLPLKSKDEMVEVIVEIKPTVPKENPKAIPHNLWMVALSDVTIWNRSNRRVSLQFELHTVVRGPVERLSELSMNTAKGASKELEKMMTLKSIPVVLEEHGTRRNSASIEGVLPEGLAQSSHLRGPLGIEPLHHAQGVLAFFYQQLDRREARIEAYRGASLVIKDRLSDYSMTIALDAVNATRGRSR